MTPFSLYSPRPVYCVIDSEHRSQKVAEEIAQGRFSFQGITLDLGVEPDWTGAELPADREWRLEWSKFYYGLDLAWAFQRTGDLRYVRTWERLVDSWIAQVPVGFDTSDVIGRRLQNWIYAWARFSRRSAARVRRATAVRLLESVSAQLAHLRANLTPERNHRTLELYAVFIAVLALPTLDPDRSIRQFAVSELVRNLHDDILPDGVHREASTHYHLLVLRSFLGLCENARRFSIALPDTVRPRLEQACEFAAHCHRPDGYIPALSDGDTGRYAEMLRLAARLFDRPDWLYVATAGRRGKAPDSTARSFEVGGYFIQRSGWGDTGTAFAKERYLIFDCGPLGDGGHGHYDMLNVEIAAGGRPLVVDPGRYTYHADEAGGPWRRWFKGTAAHNTVTVDGLDQAPYRSGPPKAPLPRAIFGGRSTHPLLDMMWGEAVSPCYDALHQRRIIFVAGEYWIIEDRLTAATPHRYDLRFHLAPDPRRRTTVQGGAQPAAAGPGVALVFGAGHDLALEEGWVSTQYGIKEAAPVVVATEHDRTTARFITLVAPLADGAPLPAMRVRTGDDATVTLVEVERVTPGVRDLVAWTSGPGRLPIESLGVMARTGVMRTQADDTRLAWYADGADDACARDQVRLEARETRP
jgi:hypothetical protein